MQKSQISYYHFQCVCVCFVGVVVVVVGEQKGGISIVASSFFSHISLPFIREAAKENDVLKTADA